jgi:small subunit ribosomal protein S17
MPRRVLEGNVVSDRMDKTVTVLVERRYMHPVYKKYIKKTDKYAAHDETNAFGIGDRVQIEECRPISKRKAWKVITPPPAKSHKGKASEEELEALEKEAKVSRPDTKKKSKKAEEEKAEEVKADEKKTDKAETAEKAKKAKTTKKTTTKKAEKKDA